MNDMTRGNSPYVRPDVQALLAMLEQMQEKQIHEMEPAEAREGFRTMSLMVDADAPELAIVRNLSFPGPAGDVPVRYYDAQETRDAGPAILFIHGGGFVIGDLDSHNSFCAEMAKQLDLPVVAVDYRLAPEAPFPAAAQDSIAAARWLASSPKELGLDITGLVPCGDSAGGNLAIVTTRALLREPANVPVIAQAPIYPVVVTHGDWQSFQDFADGFLLTSETMAYFTGHYNAAENHELFDCLDCDQSNMPPTVIVTASLDPLRDQGRAYAAALVQAGVTTSFYEAKGTVHGFICIRKGIPSGEHDIRSIFGRMNGIIRAQSSA